LRVHSLLYGRSSGPWRRISSPGTGGRRRGGTGT
jgi:hypothetical protein